MRERKYKAWHKKEHEMYSVVLLDFREGSKGVGIGYIENPSWGVRWPNPEDVELIEWTGYLNENGLAVYEYDIARNQYGEVGHIIWDDSEAPYGFTFHIISKESPNLDLEEHKSWRGLEVLGNSLENPELLEASK